ncbi:MAG: ATP-binding protein [Legionella sp.]|uniref:chemotaxis protein CheA n=1 Tax=Legionella sp. TaxID=459 RepID=UPI0039E53118
MAKGDPLHQQLIETLNAELESLLLVITTNLQKIKSNESPEDVSQLISEISYSGRTIKVAASSVGVSNLDMIAEYIERLFASADKISPELINLTFRAIDGMREVMKNFIEQKPLPTELYKLLHELQQEMQYIESNESVFIPPMKEEQVFTPREQEPTPVIYTNASEREFSKKIIETFKVELQENINILIDDLLLLEKSGQTEHEFVELMNEIFRTAHNIKGSARGIGAFHVGDIAHQLETVFTKIKKKSISITPSLINLCLQSADYMEEAMRCYSDGVPLSFNLQNHLHDLSQLSSTSIAGTGSEMLSLVESKAISKPSVSKSKTQEFDSIRVPLQNLDRISVEMEEIQGVKIAIEDHYTHLGKIKVKLNYLVQAWRKNLFNFQGLQEENKNNLFSNHMEELSVINNAMHVLQRELRIPLTELSNLFNTLQDEIRTIRLLPVESQLRYLPRVVRDLANELDKPIHLEINNNDVKIDKLILDGLKYPLVHILRNAIDHGIESTAERQQAGKPAEGTICIDVTQEDHQIVFTISDDGAGINIDKVQQIALQKNLISDTELAIMTSEEILDLIFLSGFSTREMATDISGRGVGLDVVRSSLAQLKGHISVTSELGKGTHFSLHVPITLATERGLIVSCAGQIFVITTSAVECVLLLKKEDIVNVEGCSVILIKEQPVILSSLTCILHLEKKATSSVKEYLSVVILKQDDERMALLVDDILGEREIILKPLQEPLANIPWVIGATLSGSNQINFILNIAEIMKKGSCLEI